MSLEDLYKIDMVTAPAPGRIGLHIVDTGTITDPQTRYNLLSAKLAAYARYLSSVQFSDEHPGYRLTDVTIFVDHFTPLTGGLRQLAYAAWLSPIAVVFVDHTQRQFMSSLSRLA